MSPEIQAMKDATIHRVIGPTILLGSGSYFDYEAPDRSAMTIEDVAWGLASTGRWSGQCVQRSTGRRVFYSVAQHCVLMAWEAWADIEQPGRPDIYDGSRHGAVRQMAYDALMHELGEVPCSDLSGPLKSLCPDYKIVEKRCEAALMRRFGVTMRDPDYIKLLDLRMLATERRDLTPWNGEQWGVDGNLRALPFGGEIKPWGPEEAAERFLGMYRVLKPFEVPA